MDLFVLLLIGVIIAMIWCACVQRQQLIKKDSASCSNAITQMTAESRGNPQQYRSSSSSLTKHDFNDLANSCRTFEAQWRPGNDQQTHKTDLNFSEQSKNIETQLDLRDDSSVDIKSGRVPPLTSQSKLNESESSPTMLVPIHEHSITIYSKGII